MKTRLELAKTLFEVLKQALLMVLLASLLFYPSLVGATLEKIGIQEGDIWGFKWKRSLIETDKKLVELEGENRNLVSKLKEASQTLDEQARTLAAFQSEANIEGTGEADAASIIESAQQVIQMNLQAVEQAESVSQSAQQLIIANTPLIESAEREIDSRLLRFGVVAGGDRTELAARDELRRAKAAGYESTKIYQRQNSYRTVVIFPDRSTAGANLPTIKATMNRPDAYIVDLDSWCPTAEPSSEDLVICY
jgi:hypothetical protein